MYRFGYGAIAFCDEGHRFKWCNFMYCFIPSEEWHIHTSWCPKSQPNSQVAEYIKKGQHESGTLNISRNQNTTARTESDAGGMDSTDIDENSMDYDSFTEGSELDLPTDIRNVLVCNREQIMHGDDRSTIAHWSQILREHRNRTLISELLSKSAQPRYVI